MSQEKEYDEHGRPTLFLMALRSVGVINKHDALQKSKKNFGEIKNVCCKIQSKVFVK